MIQTANRIFDIATDRDLGLLTIANAAGITISALPNGCIFSMEHADGRGRVMINQVLGSPLDGGIGRFLIRTGGDTPQVIEAMGPDAKVRFGTSADRFVWEGEAGALSHRLTLWLCPDAPLWLWYLELALAEGAAAPLSCDAVLIQDIGLGGRGFLMGCELFASQYIDHHIASHPGFGPVVMNRQNLPQDGGRHPWLAHGCLDGAAGFATDTLQLFGPAHRGTKNFAFQHSTALPNRRMQHEAACPAIRSRELTLVPGARLDLTFFGLYEPDHPEASSNSDLIRVDAVAQASQAFTPAKIDTVIPPRSIVQDAQPLAVNTPTPEFIASNWPERDQVERTSAAPDSELLSFFVPDGMLNRHVVLAAKERATLRRHGHILRSGQNILPDDSIFCATVWMHGVFGAQLVLGNASLHKLTSVSRDGYNIMRGNALRILVDTGEGEGWRHLAVPSAFDMGLNDCRWIYVTDATTITVSAAASGDDAAIQWRVTAEGRACRFLVYAQLVMGEREYEHGGRVEIHEGGKRATLLFAEGLLWSGRYPQASFDLVTATPDAVEAMGGAELLYPDGVAPAGTAGGWLALRARATNTLVFTLTGSLSDRAEAEALAMKYAGGCDEATMLAAAYNWWRGLTGNSPIEGEGPDIAAHNLLFPWLVHNGMIHLSTPHGLEQFNGGAWGTRDVCQGPVELLLALEQDEPVKDILRIVFAQQFEDGDWPQWFMLKPYSNIRALDSHGDIIVWPLKALCDYIEATNDVAFLDEPAPWHRRSDLTLTEETGTIMAHIDRAIAMMESRFIPGTALIRLGDGDWNDALQPADPKLRETMVSSWTVALLYQQLERYADVLRHAGRSEHAKPVARLSGKMLADFQRHLIEDETVAGYALFRGSEGARELIMHPNDVRTGVKYSLIPMTRGILSGVFTLAQTAHHMRLIREHLLFRDGVRLMDRPVAYHGGLERIFRRAESAAFFGREIALMYSHSHLRYCDAMAARAEWEALREGLAAINPILTTQILPNASLRQRNVYVTSSDAAFSDRYEAAAEWDRVRSGRVPLDAGWRLYSSGPGMYVRLMVRHLLGKRRYFGVHS